MRYAVLIPWSLEPGGVAARAAARRKLADLAGRFGSAPDDGPVSPSPVADVPAQAEAPPEANAVIDS